MSRHTPGHFQTLMTRNDDDGDDDVSVGHKLHEKKENNYETNIIKLVLHVLPIIFSKGGSSIEEQ